MTAQPTQQRGRFITLEGGEGAGKSTQLRLLATHLQALGVPVLTTREPGGSLGAEAIRSLLVSGDIGRWHPLTEAMLHIAARHEHVMTTILPALEAGMWVLCDRFIDSTRAYQVGVQGVSEATVDLLHQLTIGDLLPDLTLVFDLSAEEGLRRAAGRTGSENRYERMGLAFHQKLMDAFRRNAQAEPDRCVLIDASRNIDEVQARCRAILAERLGLAP